MLSASCLANGVPNSKAAKRGACEIELRGVDLFVDVCLMMKV